MIQEIFLIYHILINQKQKDMPITEYDMSGLASLADSMGGIIGGAWDKLKSRKYKLDDPSSLEGSGMDEEEYMALVKQRQAGYEDTDPDLTLNDNSLLASATAESGLTEDPDVTVIDSNVTGDTFSPRRVFNVDLLGVVP